MFSWEKLYVAPAQFYLPSDKEDMSAWATIACDQYTAQKEYWAQKEALVENKPSALRLILPECYLSEAAQRVPKIHATMAKYLSDGTLSRMVNGMILLRRTTPAGARLGLLMTVDLEAYSFAPQSKSPIRATEGTITDRIPPRLTIRQNAPLELSHILLLTDDKEHTVIEPLYENRQAYPPLYDVTLSQGGGRLEGWAIEGETALAPIHRALSRLLETNAQGDIAFAVGDGNHSLATAKTHWENVKKTLPKQEQAAHPARFATVELTNLNDPALLFEPIHRVIFEKSASAVKQALSACEPVMDLENPDFVLVHERGNLPMRITRPLHTLPVGTVQTLLDKAGFALDYVHGDDNVREIVEKENAVGIFLPPIEKSSLFLAVNRNGPLPRKTFSMGEADEKRFYIEARKILKD